MSDIQNSLAQYEQQVKDDVLAIIKKLNAFTKDAPIQSDANQNMDELIANMSQALQRTNQFFEVQNTNLDHRTKEADGKGQSIHALKKNQRLLNAQIQKLEASLENARVEIQQASDREQSQQNRIKELSQEIQDLTKRASECQSNMSRISKGNESRSLKTQSHNNAHSSDDDDLPHECPSNTQ